MGINLDKLRQNCGFGMLRNFVSASRMNRKATAASSISSNPIPYETSKEHFAYLAEIEIRRSEAIVETRKQILR